MLAKDFMTTAVITVSPDTAVSEIARTMLANQINGVPVVDTNGHVLGIVSEGDLIRRPETGTEPHHTWWLRMFGAAEDLAAEYSKTHGLRAEDVMSPSVISVPEDMPAGEIAELLEKRRIKRLPVVRGKTLVGIVSRANLIQALATRKSAASEAPTKDDRAIREQILGTIDREFGGRMWLIDITVIGGTVNIWGAAESVAEKDAIRIAAESVPGVVAVMDHVGVLRPSVRSLLWMD